MVWRIVGTIICLGLIIIVWHRSSRNHPLGKVNGFWNKVLTFLRFY